MVDVIYLFACAALSAWSLRRLGEEPEAWLGLGLLAGVSFTIPSVLGLPHLFHVMRLLAWGLFLACPAWALGAAWIVRTHSRVGAAVLVAASLVLGGLGIEAVLVEPQDLQLTRYAVHSPKVSQPVRLALLADIQTLDPGPYELGALKRAMAEQPDALLFAGDYIQVDSSPQEHVAALDRLNALMHEAGIASAPLGGWAVAGNVDRWPHFPRAFAGLPVDADQTTRKATAGELTVTALSFDDGFDPELTVAAEPGFHVVLAHGPDFALGEIEADLLVAGHTHGGQVRIPLLDWAPVTFSAIPRAWAAGRTELPSGATLIVSRGIGMERQGAPPIRLACRPEIVIIDVLPDPAVSP